MKVQEALKAGHFKKEIIPIVEKKSGKVLDKDEFPKAGTTLEGLSKLRPAFDPVAFQ
jgi:acetyl-CoA C-acetyltransferase